MDGNLSYWARKDTHPDLMQVAAVAALMWAEQLLKYLYHQHSLPNYVFAIAYMLRSKAPERSAPGGACHLNKSLGLGNMRVASVAASPAYQRQQTTVPKTKGEGDKIPYGCILRCLFAADLASLPLHRDVLLH